MTKPWMDGPKELLLHAIEHMKGDATAFDDRIAFISIDNATELMTKTYLSLPERITGLKIKKDELDEASQNFPKLLNLMEQYCLAKINGIDLGDIEWYHRLRNQLYHSGNGITIEKGKISAYFEISKILFRNLFGEDLIIPPEKEVPENLMGRFIKEWGEFERIAVGGNVRPIRESMLQHLNSGKIVKKELTMFMHLHNFRNQVVHGVRDPTSSELENALKDIEYFKNRIRK